VNTEVIMRYYTVYCSMKRSKAQTPYGSTGKVDN
jgi:hypothetical protein